MLKQAPAVCRSCGAEFRPKRAWQGYCSPRCKGKAAKRRLRAETRGRASGRSPVRGMRGHGPPAPRAPGSPSEGTRQAPGRPPAEPESYGWDQFDLPLSASPLDWKLVLSGDDYPLEYQDGYPKIPACLDRRALKKAKAA